MSDKSEKKPCVVCDQIREVMGTHGHTDEPENRYPVCLQCHESGAHARWMLKAIEELDASPHLVYPPAPHLAAAIADLRAYVRSRTREEDGVCPNGCALLEHPEPGHVHCPACGFHGYRAILNPSDL
jgi:hypothetical protein